MDTTCQSPTPRLSPAPERPGTWSARIAAAFTPGPSDSSRVSWSLIQRPGRPRGMGSGWPRAALGESRELEILSLAQAQAVIYKMPKGCRAGVRLTSDFCKKEKLGAGWVGGEEEEEGGRDEGEGQD